MKKLLEFLVTAIVKYPDLVTIEEKQEGEVINFYLNVHPEDIKLIIGRNGKTIRAVRNLLRLKAMKQGMRVNLTLEEKTVAPTS